MESDNVVGNKIKRLRKEKEMTQRDLAQALSVVHSTISNWEHGRRLPSVAELKRIGEYFDVSLAYFEVMGQPLGHVWDEHTMDRLFQTIHQTPLSHAITSGMQSVFLGGLVLILASFVITGLTGVLLWLSGVFCLVWVVGIHLSRWVQSQTQNRRKMMVPIDRHVHYIHPRERADIGRFRKHMITSALILVVSTAWYYLSLGYVVRTIPTLFLTWAATVYGILGVWVAVNRFKTFSSRTTLQKKMAYLDTTKCFHHHTVLLVLLMDGVAWTGFSLLLMVEPGLKTQPLLVGMLVVLGLIQTVISGWLFKRYHHFISDYTLSISDDEGATKQLL